MRGSATPARLLLHGALAGAAGTTALDAATYLDMVVRGRPASTTPEQTVERGAQLLNLPLPGDDDARQALESGLGSLLGALAGVATGAALGAVRGLTDGPHSYVGTAGAAFALAMVAGNGPMTVLKVTDPRSWSAADWFADLAPHLAYALVTAATLNGLEPD